MSLIQFISAFGLGAIVTALVHAWLSRKAYIAKRNFDEKKDSYLGFLDALHQSEVKGTPEAALEVGHWENRIELVGSSMVIAACVKIRESNPTAVGVHPMRPGALRELKAAMRKDLGVARLK